MKNEIQEKRMKQYFIDSAKSIIRGEGVRAISVRNIANNAGYSYATLYNYFKDLKELMFYCIIEFIDESKAFIEAQKIQPGVGKRHLIDLTKAYMNYFVQYTGIYDLFFFEKMPEISLNIQIIEKIYSYFDDLFAEDWNEIFKDGAEPERITFIKNNHWLAVQGMLTLYINRRRPITYKLFIEEALIILNGIIPEKGC